MGSEDDERRREGTSRLGSVLNYRWRLERILGEGGCAWVYAASGPGRARAAVKVLHVRYAADPSIRARFVREGKLANLITHPGVVRVIDEGVCADATPFLAMDLLEGETLAARAVRKGNRLPLNEVLWAADQVLAILAAAHARGIVHRDIKPENIFLTRDRALRLLDFGIARFSEAVRGEVTRVGAPMGSPGYMPPEQARGEWNAVGVQADLWSVGATMFTLLSGRQVHLEEDPLQQLYAVATRVAPSLGSVAPDVPEPIVLLVDLALRFDSTQRWPNATSMQYALRMAYAHCRQAEKGREGRPNPVRSPVLFETPEPPPPSSDRRRR